MARARRVTHLPVSPAFNGSSQTPRRVTQLIRPAVMPTISGYVPDANQYFAVDVGDSREIPYADLTALQVPNDLYFYSNAGFTTPTPSSITCNRSVF